MRTHRVGTITLGISLIFFGIMFILRMFINAIQYELVFKLWPIILILLGGEILLGAFITKNDKMIYDKAAILLIFVLTIFAMGMAGAQFLFEHANDFIITI